LDFWRAKTGDLDFWSAMTGNIYLREAKTGTVFIKDMKPSDKWLAKKIAKYSKGKEWKECTLSAFCKWLEKAVK
jgi:hypothetical protein